GPERVVHVRIAEHAGHIYLDLADEQWRAVDIGPDGWRVIGCPPVRFRRPAGMLPLPVPQQGGSIEALNSFLNLARRDDFVLIVAWLWAALRCGGPYPLLAISGEQGSAKTVLSKLLKALIDPNAAPVRSLSREERELMIAANADPVAACVREIMAERSAWTGSAADLLRAGGGGPPGDSTGGPKDPGALAGRLRRAQTFLRVLGIEIKFSREGRAGNRIITIRRTLENTVSTVSSVGENGAGLAQAAPTPEA